MQHNDRAYFTWMPGVWSLLQHICVNPTPREYGWTPLAACERAVIVDYPEDELVPWTEWTRCEECLDWAQLRLTGASLLRSDRDAPRAADQPDLVDRQAR